MKRLIEYLGTKPKWLLRMLGVVLIGVLGIIDYITGDYSMTVFYLGPVFLGAWFVNKRAGLEMCFLSGGVIFLAHELPHPYSYDPVPLGIWNTTMEVLFLFIMSYMFSLLKGTSRWNRNWGAGIT